MSRQAVTSYKLLRGRPAVGSHTCNVQQKCALSEVSPHLGRPHMPCVREGSAILCILTVFSTINPPQVAVEFCICHSKIE